MRRSFSYLLLITWIIFIVACKSTYISTNANTQNIVVSESLNPLDSQIVQIYLPYKNILENDMGRVISFSETEMVKDKPESSLTNFLADLLLEEAKIKSKNSGLKINPELSYFNYGGIRTFLPKGNITVGNIFELIPFENEMVFVQLTGDQLLVFFDFVAQKGGDSVGGARFIISGEKAKDVMVADNKLLPDTKYWLVTNDYIANGGDEMEFFKKSIETINSGLKIRDVIISNMEGKQKKGERLTAKPDGRISYE